MSQPLFEKGTLISIPHVRFQVSGKFTAPRTQDIGAGKSYIPPCRLSLHNPSPHKQISKRGLFAAAQTLPDSFSWNNDEEVRKHKGSEFVGLIASPLNQGKCGSCWAFATTTALNDRIAIKTGVNPHLGPSYLLSCSVSGDCDKQALAGCNGGAISSALENLVHPIGATQTACWNYDWCNSCSGDGDSDNALIPNFPSNAKKCVSAPSDKLALWKVVEGSVKTLPGSIEGENGVPAQVNYTAIKQSIFNDGPIPTGYIVLQSFFMGTAPKSQGGDNWAATKGIYLHLDTDTTGYTPDGDPSPYKYGSSADMNTEAGAHAVVIVGFGQSEIPNVVPKAWAKKNPGKPVPSTITIPYWVVRNSWGTEWCEKGFFRIAMTDPSLHIGGTVMFDQASEGSVGGVIEFHPDLSSAPKPSPSSLKSSNKSGLNILWIVFLGLLILGLSYWIFMRLDGHKSTPRKRGH